ncbi:hypothetical protein CEXT_709271 [Caerostris extrusa]|uniref:Uncharacterized protein n=1 Tax=Caerostris extrusa TaxID=172846 RepID=A0AAV4MQ52_CAEEX|nr:hypothetical protein CEXT_709271 [Caerostris extrusa]
MHRSWFSSSQSSLASASWKILSNSARNSCPANQPPPIDAAFKIDQHSFPHLLEIAPVPNAPDHRATFDLAPVTV